jgi:hypothetical protein
MKSVSWQDRFVALLPALQRRLQRNFRHLDPASREEAVAEAMALCVLAYVRLEERNRTHVASASTLAWYATRQVNLGRTAAGRLNKKEPLSRYAHVMNGISVQHDEWVDHLIDNPRWDVAEQVAVRLDARQWFKTLSLRVRRIARDLAHGFSTSEVARNPSVPVSTSARDISTPWYSGVSQASTCAQDGRSATGKKIPLKRKSGMMKTLKK